MDSERLDIFNKYRLGREGLRVDPWEDPNFQEEFARKDRFGFIHDTRVANKSYEDQAKDELERLDKWVLILGLKNRGKDIQETKKDSDKKKAKKKKVKKEMKEKKPTLWDLEFDPLRLAVKTDKMRELIYKGIPEAVRGEVWQKLLGTQRLLIQQRGVYEQMRQRACRILELQYVSQIDKDVNRCFRNHESFKDRYSAKQCSLFNVLTAYAVYNTEVGYCQGLHFVAALLLMYMDEEAAFWGLSQLLTHPKWLFHGFYSSGFPKMVRCMQFLDERVLLKLLPTVKKHLDQVGYSVPLYASGWFIQLFACRVPFPILVHLWDIMLLEGEKAVIFFAYCVIRVCKKQLLKSSIDELETFFKQDLPNSLRLRRDQTVGELMLNAREQLQKVMTAYVREPNDWPKKPFGYLTVELAQRDRYLAAHPELLELARINHNGHVAARNDESNQITPQEPQHATKCLSSDTSPEPLHQEQEQDDEHEQAQVNGVPLDSSVSDQPNSRHSAGETMLAVGMGAYIAAEFDQQMQQTHQMVVSADIESPPVVKDVPGPFQHDALFDDHNVTMESTIAIAGSTYDSEALEQSAHQDQDSEPESDEEVGRLTEDCVPPLSDCNVAAPVASDVVHHEPESHGSAINDDANLWRYGEAQIEHDDVVFSGPGDVCMIDSTNMQLTRLDASATSFVTPVTYNKAAVTVTSQHFAEPPPIRHASPPNVEPPLLIDLPPCAFDSSPVQPTPPSPPPPPPLSPNGPIVTSSVCVRSEEAQSNLNEEPSEQLRRYSFSNSGSSAGSQSHLNREQDLMQMNFDSDDHAFEQQQAHEQEAVRVCDSAYGEHEHESESRSVPQERDYSELSRSDSQSSRCSAGNSPVPLPPNLLETDANFDALPAHAAPWLDHDHDDQAEADSTAIASATNIDTDFASNQLSI